MNEVDSTIRSKLVRFVRRVSPPGMRDHGDDLVQLAAIKLMRTASDKEWTASSLGSPTVW